MSTSYPQWITDLFAAIDTRNADQFVNFLTEEVVFTFGNADPISGRPAVRQAVAGFFDSIQGVSHDVREIWHSGDAVICRGTARYTRHDGSQLSVPFANVFKMLVDKIQDYQIYVDLSQLHARRAG